MRMMMIAAILGTLTAAAPAPSPLPAGNMPVLNPNGDAAGICPATSRYEAARRGGKLPRSLLGELPAADLYKAVYRRVGGCEVPIIVRYDIGGTSGVQPGTR